MSGCPCLKWNWKKNCEVCKLTDKPTGISLICDFDYDTACANYQKRAAEKQLKSK